MCLPTMIDLGLTLRMIPTDPIWLHLRNMSRFSSRPPPFNDGQNDQWYDVCEKLHARDIWYGGSSPPSYPVETKTLRCTPSMPVMLFHDPLQTTPMPIGRNSAASSQITLGRSVNCMGSDPSMSPRNTLPRLQSQGYRHRCLAARRVGHRVGNSFMKDIHIRCQGVSEVCPWTKMPLFLIQNHHLVFAYFQYQRYPELRRCRVAASRPISSRPGGAAEIEHRPTGPGCR
ncbi:hypothetical protein BU16DRAFT_213573 [Lophium mytilinum]|uniref:Uncharacterized protein n=1 Tax=Lophium mytilinum TaxID=390894 RepID=A0A6A6Q9U5_9PEZI|nr:hypothetical protein BU16DRAFT_213573 [Lophium mytilinum]